MSIQGSGEHPTFPAQWLYGLYRALPSRAELVVTIAAREPLRNLTPASRRRDHTTSPYASVALVSRNSGVHRIPPHVRDDRDTPLVEG